MRDGNAFCSRNGRMQTNPQASPIATASDPIAILETEHRAIEHVLRGLEAVAEAAAVGAFTNAALIRDVVAFLREYADGRHHAKEEELLFPALELLGLSAEAGPTRGMRLEHVQGRKLVALLGELSAEGESEGKIDWREVSLAALAYVRLLRSHIHKEDHCLFAIAREMLGPTEKEALGRAFLRVDREWAESRGPEGDARIERVLRAFDPLADAR